MYIYLEKDDLRSTATDVPMEYCYHFGLHYYHGCFGCLGIYSEAQPNNTISVISKRASAPLEPWYKGAVCKMRTFRLGQYGEPTALVPALLASGLVMRIVILTSHPQIHYFTFAFLFHLRPLLISLLLLLEISSINIQQDFKVAGGFTTIDNSFHRLSVRIRR